MNYVSATAPLAGFTVIRASMLTGNAATAEFALDVRVYVDTRFL